MTKGELAVVYAIVIVTGFLVGITLDLARVWRKQDRHQFAYCFVGRYNLAYPCHENPHWSADL